VHDSEDVLKPHVFSRRKYPPGSLQLMYLPHSLDPRMIDQVLLGRFTRSQTGSGNERDVAVYRVVRQAFRREVANHSRNSEGLSGGGCCLGDSLRIQPAPPLKQQIGQHSQW